LFDIFGDIDLFWFESNEGIRAASIRLFGFSIPDLFKLLPVLENRSIEYVSEYQH
jgi:hypothetical protein